MDADTLKMLGELLNHGGSAGLLVALYVAMRALTMASRAVSLLKDVKEALAVNNADERRLHERMDEKLDTIHNDLTAMPLQVARLTLRKIP